MRMRRVIKFGSVGLVVVLVAVLLVVFLPVRVTITQSGFLSLSSNVVLAVNNPPGQTLSELEYGSGGWMSPIGFNDSGGVWSDEVLTYDENTTTYAYASALKGAWTDYLELTRTAIDCDKVQIWVDRDITNINTIEVDVYYGSAWNNIFSGAPSSWGSFVEYTVGSTQSVTAMRIRFYSTKTRTDGCHIVEADFNEVVLEYGPGCSSELYIDYEGVSNSLRYTGRDGVSNSELYIDAYFILNTPGNKAFGMLEVNTYSSTPINYFTITNQGDSAVDIVVYATDLTGGDDTWDLSDTATPGENIYGLKAGLDDADDLFDVIVRETETYNELVNNLLASASQDWGLELYMPTSVTDYDGQEMSATLTLVCSAH